MKVTMLMVHARKNRMFEKGHTMKWGPKSTLLMMSINTVFFMTPDTNLSLSSDRVRNVGDKKCQDIEHRYEEEKKSVKKQYNSNMDVSYKTVTRL